MPAQEVLVVDGANVVGSRPDGWWRDRPGAAARLHASLVAAALPERVVLVLEGQARRGVAVSDDPRVTVVHAPGEGDDEIVRQAEAHHAADDLVVVVTADRALRARLADGVDTIGPGALLARLG